jgi:hypothetical protein
MDHPDHCPLCEQEEETINHLLTSCVFARQVWFDLLSTVSLQELTPQPADDSFEEWWRRSNTRLQGQCRRGFNSLVILDAWIIWKHRNQCVFKGVSPSVPFVLQAARDEALLWTMAGAKDLSFLHAIHPQG